MGSDRTKRVDEPLPPILASFETPEQHVAEIYETGEDGLPRVVRAAAADKAAPGGASMGFSAEELNSGAIK
jgi:hypothetical protein